LAKTGHHAGRSAMVTLVIVALVAIAIVGGIWLFLAH
jgi:hypothetical protein